VPDSLRSLDALCQPKTHRLWLVFLGQSGKRGKETPQGTNGPLTSYALRARMHSTSQKSIACGSYFWSVMDPCASGVQTNRSLFRRANWLKILSGVEIWHGFPSSFCCRTAQKCRSASFYILQE
jgi:hypothetical protein